MLTDTLLPYVRVTTYDLKKNEDRTFANDAAAQAWIAKSGAKLVNVYRIEKVNGTWRTDWQLSAAGRVLTHDEVMSVHRGRSVLTIGAAA